MCRFPCFWCKLILESNPANRPQATGCTGILGLVEYQKHSKHEIPMSVPYIRPLDLCIVYVRQNLSIGEYCLRTYVAEKYVCQVSFQRSATTQRHRWLAMERSRDKNCASPVKIHQTDFSAT